MEEFARLVALMASLRGEQGCPWDKKQTEKAFRTFLLEETYEVIDAIEKEDHAALKEELGDLLFHIVFIAQICKEKGLFNIEDVITSAYTKMYNRHPHVFRRDQAQGPQEGATGYPRAGGPGIDFHSGASGNLSSERGEREGEAPAALPQEGATRAPGIERWIFYNSHHSKRRGDRVMAEEKYTCNKCGMTFEKKPDKHQCPLCGSLDVKQASEKPAASGCEAKTRFS